MLTEPRWLKEQELMRSVFPEFKPFVRGARFGFDGHLKGLRSGQVYHVTLEADQATYPQAPPRVGMFPRIGIHWIGEGEGRRLCMERDWRPARSTFANTLLALIRYIDEHDPQAGVKATRESDDRRTPDLGTAGAAANPPDSLWGIGRWRGGGRF